MASHGAFTDADACMTGLAEAYPDPKVRAGVCDAVAGRRPRREEESPAGAVARAEDGSPSKASRVQEGPSYWIVRGLVAARAGVNRSHRVRRRLEVVQQTARLLDGAAVIYGHPKDGSIDVDRMQAPGIVVASRLEGDAAVYDALLWKQNPEGHAIAEADLERNRIFAAAASDGKAIHNSIAAWNLEVARRGEAEAVDGDGTAPYDHEIVQVTSVGHVAVLAPVVPVNGSCPPSQNRGCGLPPQEAGAVAAVLGVRREAVVLAAAAALRGRP